MDRQNAERSAGQQLAVRTAAVSNEVSIYDASIPHSADEDELDLRALWRTIFRYRKLIGAITGIFILMTLLATLLMRPVYTSSILLEINTEGRNLVKFTNLEDRKVDADGFLATQIKILQSRTIAEDVVDRLELTNEPEFSGKLRQRGLLAGLRSVISLFRFGKSDIQTQEKVDLARSIYANRLEVSQFPSSSLISVSIDSFDPQLSAKIANQHAESYIRLNDKRRFSSTSGAKNFLESEIKAVQRRLETSEKRLTSFARKHGVVDVEDRNNVLLVRLSQINQAIADVQNKRIDAETRYVQSKSSNAERLAAVFDDQLIKLLREEQAAHKAQYIENLKIYKKKFPLMVQLKAKIDELEQSIRSQADKIVSGFETTYEQLVLRETLLRKELADANTQLLDLKDRAVSYNILKREWEANKELYSGLLERTKEVGVAAGMELNVAAIIESAAVPTKASSPKLSLNMALAMLAGLGCGLVTAFFLAMLDNTVNDVEQLQHVSQIGNLGLIPDMAAAPEAAAEQPDQLGRKLNAMVHSDPGSEFSESIQSVRTSLSFARTGGFPRTMMVTSSIAGEGKSTASMNLAISCAKAGMRVLLIEADLRRPNQHKVFGAPSSPGLSDYLAGNHECKTYKVSQIQV